MTQKEKAKRYDEAIERAKELLEIGVKDTRDKRVVLSFFPELKESEDERVRKEIIQFFKEKDEEDFEEWVPKVEILTWLEKQVPACLSHDDEIMIRQLTEYFTTGKGLQNTNDTVVEWLTDVKRKLEKQGKQKSIDDLTQQEAMDIAVAKCFEQGKQEYIDPDTLIQQRVDTLANSTWSKKDEEIINTIILVLNVQECWDEAYKRKENPYQKEIYWLKSLKDRYTWKPSDEHYELEEFAKIVRGNLTGISKAVQELFEAKYLQLTGNKMYKGFKD